MFSPIAYMSISELFYFLGSVYIRIKILNSDQTLINKNAFLFNVSNAHYNKLVLLLPDLVHMWSLFINIYSLIRSNGAYQ